MTMDLISGLAIVASMFMLATAILAVLASRPSKENGHSAFLDTTGIATRALATLVVVFFIITSDLLLIAQQVSLALGTFVVGILVVVVLYLEPSLRSGKRDVKEAKEDWRR